METNKKKSKSGMNSAMHYAKYVLMILLVSIIITHSASAITGTSSDVRNAIIAWNRLNTQIDYNDLKQYKPTFTSILTTYYVTAQLDDDAPWCNTRTGKCIETKEELKKAFPDRIDCINQNYNWCCVGDESGVYEEARCQGSVAYAGRVYQYMDINPTKETSTPLPPQYTRGKTSKGTNPTPKRTVAINPVPGSECAIPYGTLMYIYWGPYNQHNGLYVSEDTGSAFGGKCKMDIYAGLGEKDSFKSTYESMNKKYPKIYVVDSEGNPSTSPAYKGPKIVGSSGSYSTKYSNTQVVQNSGENLKQAKEIAGEILKECQKLQTINEKTNCIKKVEDKHKDEVKIDVLTSENYNASDREEALKGMGVKLGDCALAKEDECSCTIEYKAEKDLTFTEHTISLTKDKNEKIGIQYPLKKQDSSEKSYVEISAENTFREEITSDEIVFKKTKTGNLVLRDQSTLTTTEPNLKECTPQKNYLLFEIKTLQAKASNCQNVVDYAKEYLGTGYGGIGVCTAVQAQANKCTTQCGSFISNVYDKTTHTDTRTNDGGKKCENKFFKNNKFTDISRLRPGDIITSDGGSEAGHVALYVGKGTISKEANRKPGSSPCYLDFKEDSAGEDVFIHSIGPVCYNTLNQLKNTQNRRITAMCEHDNCTGPVEDVYSDKGINFALKI